MIDIDKYYDGMDQKLVDITVDMIKDALHQASEIYYMTEREINVLARILVWRKNGNNDGGMYEHVVDYLWMAYHIGFNQKMLLMDLLNE